MLSLRWYERTPESVCNAFARDHSSVRFAWITTDLERTFTHCVVGPEEWIKGGHHATWYPDGNQISMNVKIDRDDLTKDCDLSFVKVYYDGSGYERSGLKRWLTEPSDSFFDIR